MNQLETEHYIFNFPSGSKAEHDIKKIADMQEACASYMCTVLGIDMKFKLQYFLCDTAEEVGQLYKGSPINGLACYPDKIYAVYNDDVQCFGFHEDAHLISFMWFDPNPDNPAIEEGFAEYFSRKWWGIHNFDWVGYYIKCGKYIPIDKLLDADTFYTVSDSISYPTMGTFTEWLVAIGGMEKYLNLFRGRDQKSAIFDIYGKTPQELNAAFVRYMSLHETDKVLEQRMAELSKDW